MTQITFVKLDAKKTVDLLIVPLCQGELLPCICKEIDQALNGGLTLNQEREKFCGEAQQVLVVTTNGFYPIPHIVLVGLGHREQLTSLILQEIGGVIETIAREKCVNMLGIDITCVVEERGATCLLFGVLLKHWIFDKYCSKKAEKKLSAIQVYCRDPQTQEEAFQDCYSIYKGVVKARELTAEPANMLFPQAFAERCLELQSLGLQVEVLSEKRLEEIGMHALIAVGKGSINPPRLVVIKWQGADASIAPVAIVGKGVCYDSGGINIKTEHLVEMKWDKAAAGTVVGTLEVLARIKAPINVVGIVGLVENMPDGAAMKPGDIISTYAGKSIEVIDTDNEGRLVLADCIWYAQEQFSPSIVIDLGTLTMETFGALAGEYAGLFCEDLMLSKELIAAGNISGEKLWSLPMGKAFAKQLRSTMADMKNMGVLGYGECGACAEFLKCFVKPGVRWAHLDISGVAWSSEDQPLSRAGVNGFGVRLLVEWMRQNLGINCTDLHRIV